MRISHETSLPCRRKGISLIEMLVTITIIATLAALLFVTLPRAREYVNMTTCLSNQRSLFQGFINYATDHNGYLPTSMNNSWPDQITGYLGIVIPKGQTPGSPPCDHNVFLCPSVTRDDKPWRSYALNSRAGDKNGTTDDKPVQIGQASKTALLSDAKNVTWLMSMQNASTRHLNNTANVLFFDGHVESLSATQIAKLVSWVFIDGEAQ